MTILLIVPVVVRAARHMENRHPRYPLWFSVPFMVGLAYVMGRVPDAVATKRDRIIVRVCQFILFGIFLAGFIGLFILGMR
jgi:hypothetical protein